MFRFRPNVFCGVGVLFAEDVIKEPVISPNRDPLEDGIPINLVSKCTRCLVSRRISSSTSSAPNSASLPWTVWVSPVFPPFVVSVVEAISDASVATSVSREVGSSEGFLSEGIRVIDVWKTRK